MELETTLDRDARRVVNALLYDLEERGLAPGVQLPDGSRLKDLRDCWHQIVVDIIVDDEPTPEMESQG